MKRQATIVGASIEDEGGRGDGAYSLLDVTGTPAEIGFEIACALKESDLTNVPPTADLYLNLRIKIERTT